jgi:transcriptional regulator with XRE-family HTH domain
MTAIKLRGKASEDDVRFGRMLKAVLDMLGMKKGYLAALMGISPQSLSDKMNGRSPWTLAEMNAAAAAAGVPRQVLERDPEAVIAELSERFVNYRSA